jgi:hypothetical protein
MEVIWTVMGLARCTQVLLAGGHPQYVGVSIIFCEKFETELSRKIRLPFPITGFLPSPGTHLH